MQGAGLSSPGNHREPGGWEPVWKGSVSPVSTDAEKSRQGGSPRYGYEYNAGWYRALSALVRWDRAFLLPFLYSE